MRERLLSVIKDICTERENNRIFPAAALYPEIASRMEGLSAKELKEALNQLVKEGKVKWHRTINQTAFRIK